VQVIFKKIPVQSAAVWQKAGTGKIFFLILCVITQQLIKTQWHA